MELKGTKINFLGDSITEGAGTSSHEKMSPFCFGYASKRREPMAFTQKIPLYIALKLSTVTPSAFSIVSGGAAAMGKGYI